MRKWMIDIRLSKGLSLLEMAKKCEMSVTLLEMIEEFDAITHPRIAARIADEYGFNVDQYNHIIPSSYQSDVIPPREPKIYGGNIYDEEEKNERKNQSA